MSKAPKTSCFWERCSFKDDNIRGGGAAAGRGFTKGGLSQSPWTHDLDLSHLLSKRFYLLLFCVEFEKKKTFAQLHVRSITWAVIWRGHGQQQKREHYSTSHNTLWQIEKYCSVCGCVISKRFTYLCNVFFRQCFSRKSSFIFAQLWKCYKNSSFLLNDIWLKILPKHFCVFATVWHRQTYSSSVVLCLDGSGGRKVLRGATTTMIPSWVRSIGGLWCVLDGNQTWCLCLEWDTLYSAGVVDWWASPWFGSCPNFQSNGQWLYRHAGTRETIISSSREISTSLILSDWDFRFGEMAQGVSKELWAHSDCWDIQRQQNDICRSTLEQSSRLTI